jgi:CRISPR-associated endoribonuclease Cas6
LRVKLTLAAAQKGAVLPLNYQYTVASLIYSTLGNASTEFASKLHEEGFVAEGKKFKLFSFSRLTTVNSRVAGDKLVLNDPTIFLQVSSPVEEFIEHFVAGLFQSQTFNIAGTHFHLEQAETLPAPVFTEKMSFRALSPITEWINEGQKHPRFLSLEDDWSAVIRQNLIRKYLALHGREPVDTRLIWEWDHEYAGRAARAGRRLSVLTNIRDTQIRGWLAPFHIEGSPGLIQMGYEAGYGAKNAMGFGMAEATS